MFEDDDFTGAQEPRPHAKRMGRELAMQYLFRCDMRQELPDAETFARFYDQIREEHGLKENRFGRKVDLKLDLIGGLILIAIGAKILIEHLYLNK